MSDYGEPWELIAVDDERVQIYCRGFRISGTVSKEHGERIVACVNFCRSIPTNALTAMPPAKCTARMKITFPSET